MSDDPNTPMATSDNFVVASEVMASAIRILALLDLSDREIADLFEAEAGEGTTYDHSRPADFDDDEETEARPWRLDTLAENKSFYGPGRKGTATRSRAPSEIAFPLIPAEQQKGRRLVPRPPQLA